MFCRLFQWTLDENLAVFPAHHSQIHGIGTVLLNIPINSQASKDYRGIWRDLNTCRA